MVYRGVRHLHLAILRAFQHDALLIAKGAAFSSMMTLFPGLLVMASLISRASDSYRFFSEISYALGRILPPGTAEMAQRYFSLQSHRAQTSIRWSAASVAIFASTGVIISWMQGFRRAYGIEKNPWGLVKERLIAIALVPSALVPMAFATALVAFGNQIEIWLSIRVIHELRPIVFFIWTLARWCIAILTSISVLALIYHFAIPRGHSFQRILPGAALATALWFPATAAFGWYVTHYANYAVIYGSLGVAIALLVWLYMISLIVLLGAEFNATVYPHQRTARRSRRTSA